MDEEEASVELNSVMGEQCSLDQSDLDDRRREIDGLIGRALQERRDEAGTTVLSFDRAAGAEVRDLIRRERECCGHLSFAMEEDDAVIRVTIRLRPDE
jgi:hypothetical protein